MGIRGKYNAYELLGILKPEENRSDNLIGCVSNIGNCYN